jgi:hypothetical protein
MSTRLVLARSMTNSNSVTCAFSVFWHEVDHRQLTFPVSYQEPLGDRAETR